MIITRWIILHTENPQDPWIFFITPLALLIIFIGGAYLLRRYYATHQFNITPLSVLGSLFLGAILIFNLASFLRISPLSSEAIIPPTLWWFSNGVFLLHLATLASTLIFATVCFFLTGTLLAEFLFPQDTSSPSASLRHLTSIVLGMFSWILFAFILGLFHLLKPLPISLIVFAIFWFGKKYFRPLLVWLNTSHSFSGAIRGPFLTVALLGMFLIALSLVEGVRPTPSGYDDMTAYMNHVELMVERGTLIPGGNPFPFELLAATVQSLIAHHALLFGMSFGILCFLFGGYAMYAFATEILNERVGLLAATLWLSLPMTSALTFREVKPDIFLYFITTLCFWSWIRWVEQRDTSDLYRGAFLFGFAISIKYTALLLIGSFFATLLWNTWQQNPWPRFTLRTFVLTLGCLLLPLLPWMSYNLASIPNDQKLTLSSFVTSSAENPILTKRTWDSIGIDPTLCQSTGMEEDYARYHSNHPTIINTLLTPWDLTMNARMGNFVTEIGFLFLVLLPLFILKRDPLQKTSIPPFVRTHFQLLGMLSIGYYALWFLLARSVPWYGFPGLLLLSFLVASLVVYPPRPKLKYIVWTIFLFGLTANTIVRLKFSLQPASLQYAGGMIDEAGYARATFPLFIPALEIFNQKRGGVIVVIGSGIRYFIKDNDHRVLSDSSLDIFACLNHEEDPVLTLKRLQTLHIRYFYLSADVLAQRENSQSPTLKRKVARFVEFSEAYLPSLVQTKDGIVYEVPKKASD